MALIEGTVIQDDSLIPITEKVYQHGKLKKGTNKIVYKLRTDKTQNIETIIFSSNSDKLDFIVSRDESGKEIINYNNTKKSYPYKTSIFKNNLKNEVIRDNLNSIMLKVNNFSQTTKVNENRFNSSDIDIKTDKANIIWNKNEFNLNNSPNNNINIKRDNYLNDEIKNRKINNLENVKYNSNLYVTKTSNSPINNSNNYINKSTILNKNMYLINNINNNNNILENSVDSFQKKEIISSSYIFNDKNKVYKKRNPNEPKMSNNNIGGYYFYNQIMSVCSKRSLLLLWPIGGNTL